MHIPQEDLERYSTSRLPEAESGPLEEHLRSCEACQARLERLIRARRAALERLLARNTRQPLDILHYTEDGPIYSQSTKLKGGRWLARHWGRELHGGRVCRTLREANEYLLRSFAEMFPEHRCNERCRPPRGAPEREGQ